jgi:putative ABC transport system substrate-binding protein
MKRREFISFGGAVIAWPFAARAQQPDRVRRIGLLTGYAESDPEGQSPVAAFRRSLRQLGWIEGRNVRIDYRWAAGEVDLLQKFAKELVDLQPDVVLAVTTPSVTALLKETRTVPIVFVQVSDPVGQGFVVSLARPDGNATGFTLFEYSVAGKLLEALKEIAPGIVRVALIFNPDNPASAGHWRMFETFAPSFAVDPIAAPVHNPAEIERSIEAIAQKPNSGLLAPPDVTVTTHRELIVALTARYRLPATYWNHAFVLAGGLMSYGPDLIDQYRRAASYVDRILKGDKPADLPVQQPTKFDLAINLTTAKALGLTVPTPLLVRADEVID